VSERERGERELGWGAGTGPREGIRPVGERRKRKKDWAGLGCREKKKKKERDWAGLERERGRKVFHFPLKT